MDFTDQIVSSPGPQRHRQTTGVDLAARGAVVVGCGRSLARLKEVLKQVRQTSPSSLMIGCDVGDAEQVRGMVGKVLADYGKVDVLVNNAGIGMRKPFIETPLTTIEEIDRVNYLGAVYCAHAVLPSMIARGSGHIVNISSVAGLIGMLNMGAYCASKFAMNGWSESLYHELKPLGVKVSVVCPGPVHTGFSRDFRDSEPQSPESLYVSINAVSDAIIRVVERDTAEYVMPRSLALLCWIKGFAPDLFRYLAQRRFRSYVTAPANPHS
jgi:short-subunit dehydrogenase